MPIPIHTRHDDAISIYSVATKHEGSPAITGYRRAARGLYGDTFMLDGVLCASVTELKRRGIIKGDNGTRWTRHRRPADLVPAKFVTALVAHLAVTVTEPDMTIRAKLFETALAMNGISIAVTDDNRINVSLTYPAPEVK